jgi:hypothetical protein
MRTVDLAQHGATWTGSINGRAKATGASAAAVMIAIAKLYANNVTLYAPAAMAQPMKAGDIKSRGDINSVAAPAYNSSHR